MRCQNVYKNCKIITYLLQGDITLIIKGVISIYLSVCLSIYQRWDRTIQTLYNKPL